MDSWSRPCICNAIYVGGGIGLAAATTIFHGVGSRTTFLIYEDLLFCLVLAYTLVLFGQSLQRKYHLQVPLIFFFFKRITHCYVFPRYVNPLNSHAGIKEQYMHIWWMLRGLVLCFLAYLIELASF